MKSFFKTKILMARTKRSTNTSSVTSKRTLRNQKLTRFLICNYCDSFLFSSSTNSGTKLTKKGLNKSSPDSSSFSNIDPDNVNNLDNLNDTMHNINGDNDSDLNTSEYYGESKIV